MMREIGKPWKTVCRQGSGTGKSAAGATPRSYGCTTAWSSCPEQGEEIHAAALAPQCQFNSLHPSSDVSFATFTGPLKVLCQTLGSVKFSGFILSHSVTKKTSMKKYYVKILPSTDQLCFANVQKP